MAKAADPSAAPAGKIPKKKAVRRQLEEAKLAHVRAERKTGKLRARLERAEGRLARAAESLVALQSSLEQTESPAVPKQDTRVKAAAAAKTAAAKKSAPATGVAIDASNAHAAKRHTAKKAAGPGPNGKPSSQDAAELNLPATDSAHAP